MSLHSGTRVCTPVSVRCRLLVMVILFCGLGNSVLYMLLPLLTGICYIAAPALYNPKPTYRALLEDIEEFGAWLTKRDDTFDSDVYQLIDSSKTLLDAHTKVLQGPGLFLRSLNFFFLRTAFKDSPRRPFLAGPGRLGSSPAAVGGWSAAVGWPGTRRLKRVVVSGWLGKQLDGEVWRL